MIRRPIFFSLVVLLYGCINPADFSPGDPQDILIVEGFIDNDYGPHEITVSFVTTFAGVLDGGGNRRIMDAEVTIIDDLGNYTSLENQSLMIEDLFNANPMGCSPAIGTKQITTNYMTPEDFTGVVGRSYVLEIRLSDKVYRSSKQTIKEQVRVDSAFTEFISLPGENDLIDITGVDVLVVFENNADSSNFYFWQLDGIYNIQTPPINDGISCCLYDPRDDLGTDCWVTERNINKGIFLFDGQRFNGDVIERAGFVEDDGKRFTSRKVPGDKQYYVNVKQYVISEEVYNFYSQLKVLAEIDGEIFDPPPVSVPSNIYNVDDPNEQVIGVFGAYSKYEIGVFVKRSQLSSVKNNNVCGDCRYFLSGDLQVPDVYR
ncbi:MAG: DUF4249 domain-containing protein [Bacteroidota bacterium]